MARHYLNVTKSIIPMIDKHTIQIFYKTDNDIIPFGTGILVTYKNHFFIISAAHVLEIDHINNLLFEISGNEAGQTCFKGIGKYAVLTSQKVEDKRDNDKLDIAIMKLLGKEDIEKLREHFDFYEYSEADFNHNPIEGIPYYVVFGYPATQTKINRHKRNKYRKAFVFNSRTRDFPNCEEENYSIDDNIFIDFPKKLQNGESGELFIPPNPRGISGCGLWCITDSVNLQSRNWHYKLVGIMIEHHEQGLLVATKLNQIDAIIRFINQEIESD